MNNIKYPQNETLKPRMVELSSQNSESSNVIKDQRSESSDSQSPSAMERGLCPAERGISVKLRGDSDSIGVHSDLLNNQIGSGFNFSYAIILRSSQLEDIRLPSYINIKNIRKLRETGFKI